MDRARRHAAENRFRSPIFGKSISGGRKVAWMVRQGCTCQGPEESSTMSTFEHFKNLEHRRSGKLARQGVVAASALEAK